MDTTTNLANSGNEGQSTSVKLLARIKSKTARIGIIGLGYVGLPLVRAFSDQGFRVLGFDTDAAKIRKLGERSSYIGHISSDVIARMFEHGFEPTGDFLRLSEVDVVVICVPTPLTEARDPDLGYVVRSTQAISERLRVGQLVVLESTTYPGTTRCVVLPILEESGLIAGRDFFLAFSPEREDPGNPVFSAPQIPKVVGGLDPASLELTATLYGLVTVQVVRASSPEVAEASKILENTYRAVNIALVNELKMLYDRMGVNIWEVINAAKTKPFGFQAFYPGPGLGGHCIPIDPFYLTWVARKHGMSTRFIELAGEINTAMPEYVVSKTVDALNNHCKAAKGSKITLLGMAYKRDVDDPRESPGFEIMDLLLKKGALLDYNDPHIPTLPAMRKYPNLSMNSQELTPEYLQSRDCLIIVTDHSAYDWKTIVKHATLIVDTRYATKELVGGNAEIVLA